MSRSRRAVNTLPWGHPTHSPGGRGGTGRELCSPAAAGRPSAARSTSGLNSPIAGNTSLPWQAMPQARTWVSMTGSSSSTT